MQCEQPDSLSPVFQKKSFGTRAGLELGSWLNFQKVGENARICLPSLPTRDKEQSEEC